MRRSWLLFVLAAVIAGLAVPAYAHAVTFTHGVASGDVTPNSAIVWTRLDAQTNPVEVVVSTKGDFSTVAFRAKAPALAENDFTVKIDATRLNPSTKYFYRFNAFGVFSPVGTFRTAPNPTVPASLHFTYSGDSDGTKTNRPPEFDNMDVLNAARAENGAFWSYLGDTIYSDSDLRPGGPATTLSQYRGAYKVNRTYAPLRNMFRTTSTYAQLDDHEVQNDFDGQTVDPARYAAGREAFLEYMPIRTTGLLQDATCAGGGPLYRQFKWGSEVDIIIPDERSCRSADVRFGACNSDLAPTAPTSVRQAFGISPNPPPGCLDEINAPGRTVLGPVQKQALKNALLNSTAKYKFIINEYPIQQLYFLPYDRWEGYGAERTELINFIRLREIENVVFLTTDTHATIFNEVFKDKDTRPAPVAYEAVSGPIVTNTLEKEALAVGGQFALDGVNALMDYAEVDCRDLDTFSYGLVNVNAATGAATIGSKDVTGAAVRNEGDPGGAPCTKVFGP